MMGSSDKNGPIRKESYPANSAQVLVVEDDITTRQSIRVLLESWGYSVFEAEHGGDALNILCSAKVDLVLSDIEMPILGGLDFLNIIGKDYPQTKAIIVSGICHEKTVDQLIADGAVGYVQKPIRIPELKSQVVTALRAASMAKGTAWTLGENLVNSASSHVKEIARILVVTSDLHHGETGAHIQRIGALSRLLAELIGLPKLFARDLGDAAVLHDVGKLAIPDAILKKPGPLTHEEFEIMKKHPVLGAQILAVGESPALKLAHAIALYHHERWDGSGYPEGLVAENCPIAARIVGVADVFDALNEKRVYKAPWPREKIMNFFRAKKGSFFEPRLIDAFLGNYLSFENICRSHQESELP